MPLSWRIASVRGIAIRVHATFLFVVALGAVEWGLQHGPRGAVFGAVLVLALFACVALHELGHSLVAQRLGVSVREILLLPIGGIARLSREPKTALHELLIAVAGPAVNVVIAVVLIGLALIGLGPTWFSTGAFMHEFVGPPSALGFLAALIVSNVGLAVFNMVPALPMDGGRVFRALLSFPLGKLRATLVAAAVGQVLAAAIGLAGLFGGNLILALIGAFVFLGAAQERSAARTMSRIAGLTAGDAVNPRAVVLAPGDFLGVAMQYALRTPQPHFAVVLGDRVVGTLARDEILDGVRRQGPMVYVAGAMHREIEAVDERAPLDGVRSRLIERQGQPLLVHGAEGPIGLIGLEDIARAASMSDVLQHLHTQRAAQADVATSQRFF
jgi:Zn-dependent protease